MRVSISILLGIVLSFISIYLRENRSEVPEVSVSRPVELKKKYQTKVQLTEQSQVEPQVKETSPEVETFSKREEVEASLKKEALVEDKVLLHKMSEIEKKRKMTLDESQNASIQNSAEDKLTEENLNESIEVARKAFEAENAPMKVKR